jgi:hypothetical protein
MLRAAFAFQRFRAHAQSCRKRSDQQRRSLVRYVFKVASCVAKVRLQNEASMRAASRTALTPLAAGREKRKAGKRCERPPTHRGPEALRIDNSPSNLPQHVRRKETTQFGELGPDYKHLVTRGPMPLQEFPISSFGQFAPFLFVHQPSTFLAGSPRTCATARKDRHAIQHKIGTRISSEYRRRLTEITMVSANWNYARLEGHLECFASAAARSIAFCRINATGSSVFVSLSFCRCACVLIGGGCTPRRRNAS